MENAGLCLISFCVILLITDKIFCDKNTSRNHSVIMQQEVVTQFSNSTQLQPLEEMLWRAAAIDYPEEPRKGSKNQGDNILTRLIPMLATPFLIQTTFLPMVLLGMKFLLIQSIFLGKLAIIFGLVNLLRSRIEDNQGQFYSHNIHLGHHMGHDS